MKINKIIEFNMKEYSKNLFILRLICSFEISLEKYKKIISNPLIMIKNNIIE